MKLQIVDFETAKDLKELGFHWLVTKYYNYKEKLMTSFETSGSNEREYHFEADDFFDNWNDGRVIDNYGTSYWGCSSITFKECYSAPEQALVVKWLRDVHNIYLITGLIKEERFLYSIYINHWKISVEEFTSFEKAEAAGIKECIKYLKNV